MDIKNEVFTTMSKTKSETLQEAMIKDVSWYTVILGVFGRFLSPFWSGWIQPKVEGLPLR